MHKDQRSTTIESSCTPNYKKVLSISALGVLVMPLLSLILPAQAAIYPSVMLNESEFQLFVSPAAPNLPADSESYHVMIQLQTADDDTPFNAPAEFEIRLVSSDPSVVGIPQERIIFGAGQSMIKAEIKTTEKAGIASITALAEGVASHTSAITTLRMDSFEPTRLAIYAAPPSFIPDPKFVGMVYVQLLNSQSLPAVSKIDTPVDLSSSESTVGKTPSFAVIPAGSSGVLVEFTPQKNIGHTTLKASALGLAPAELQVNVQGPVAEKILIEFAPDVLPAVNYNDAVMTIQLVDEDNNPVKASSTTRITLRSSDSSIAEVPQYVEILAGHSYATSFVKSKGTVGSVTITASATGYETGLNSIEAIPMSTASLEEAKVLKVFSVPSILPPDNSEHQSIVLAFQDDQGNPYRQSNYIYSRIALSTSNTQLGDITSTSFIGKETYAIGKFKTKYAIGDTVLTASAQSYQPGQFELIVAGSGPAAVSLIQLPGIIEAKGLSSNSLIVSLLGHSGEPVAAQEDTTVYLSSSSTDVAKVHASVLIPAGESHVITEVQSTQKAGQTIISGASEGLASGSTTYRTVGFSGSISEYHLGLYSIPKLPADGKAHEAIIVQLQDQSGLPVLAKADTEVSLSAASFAGGSIQDKVVIRAGTNLAGAIFTTSVLEDKEFKVTASGQGFQSVELELETANQPLTIVKSTTFPSRANFEDEILVGVDVYSGAIPIEGVTVTITGTSAEDNVIMTDASGHAEGRYVPTMPGTNSIAIVANKPGYIEEILTSRVILDQSVRFIVGAETLGGNEIVSQVKISGPGSSKIQTSKPGAPISYDDAKWGSYTLDAQEQIKTGNAIYDFTTWSDGSTDNPRTISVVDDTEIKAIYNAQYLLQVVDPSGLAQGEGYYAEGTSVTLAVSETSVGGILVDKMFNGWSGDIVSSMASTSITMDGPKTANALWSDNYLKIVLIIVAVAGAGFFYYSKVFKPKKMLEEKQRAPDLDWYKS
jgi:hypothetical protein